MPTRTVLPLAALSLCVVIVSLSPTTAHADTRVGRLGILCDVHGYRVGNYVVVPLRGIAEWLGAEVTYKNPTIELKRGKHVAKITLNKKTATVDGRQITLPTAPKVYDGITCVPLKLVSAAFPVDVEYRAKGDPEVEKMQGLAFVEIVSHGRSARVIVHATSPATTAQLIREQEDEYRKRGGYGGFAGFGASDLTTDGWQYGIDWVAAAVKVLEHGYVWTEGGGVWFRDSDSRFSWQPIGVIWKRVGETWIDARSDHSQNAEWRDIARRAGVFPETIEPNSGI